MRSEINELKTVKKRSPFARKSATASVLGFGQWILAFFFAGPIFAPLFTAKSGNKKKNELENTPQNSEHKKHKIKSTDEIQNLLDSRQ